MIGLCANSYDPLRRTALPARTSPMLGRQHVRRCNSWKPCTPLGNCVNVLWNKPRVRYSLCCPLTIQTAGLTDSNLLSGGMTAP